MKPVTTSNVTMTAATILVFFISSSRFGGAHRPVGDRIRREAARSRREPLYGILGPQIPASQRLAPRCHERHAGVTNDVAALGRLAYASSHASGRPPCTS